MTQKNDCTEKLFSYGTLRYEAVQLATFGRILMGCSDVLVGYQLSALKINDPQVVAASGEAIHPILTLTDNKDDKVEGTVFDVTLQELEQADQYEVAEYKRVSVDLLSGIRAWVYVSA